MISLISAANSLRTVGYRLTVALALAAALAACTPGGAEHTLEDYLARLARTLDQDAPARVQTPWPRLPDSAALKLQLAGSKLDALDFLSLSGCAVQVTIGKRNSSLGRLAPPSQRLLLDLEYLDLAPACVRSLQAEGETDLADTLQQAWEQKREQLPYRIFLATLGSTEYRAQWRKPASLAGYPEDTSSVVVTALAAIDSLAQGWLSGDYQADNMEFEIFLGEVATGDAGALMEALALQASWLEAADGVLERRIAQGPLCSAGRRPPEADILRTVVHKFFIGAVQPWSADISRRQYELLAPLRSLERRLGDALPPAYREWQVQREAFIEHSGSAPKAHVQLLQQLLDPCTGNANGNPLNGGSTVP